HMLGDLNYIDGNDFIALHKLRLALNAYATIHHDAVQGLYSLMGRIYTRQRDYKNALHYALLALKAAESVGDNSIQMCMINNDIARTFSELGEKDKALAYYEKALDVAKTHKDYKAIYVTTTEMANVWSSRNKPFEAINILNRLSAKYERPTDIGIDYNIARAYITSYPILKQYHKAEPYCNQLLTMVKTLKLNDYANIACYAEVIKFYINSGQFELATKYLIEHKKLAGKLSELLHMGNNNRFWFMLDTARHDYRSAVNHLIAYKRLDDSLFNQTKSHQISELQVQYETEKKEKDIVVKDQNIQLLTKQDQLQKNKLKQGATLRNITFAVVALLFIIMGLLYNRYRLKQRTNRKLEAQQHEIAKQNLSLQHLVSEKEWLLKEIHHRVKNNLQIVMSLLNSQSAYIQNDAALTAIHDSQHRVHAMSLIHQKLYNSENVSSIDMTFYIRELVSYLRDSFNTGQRLRFEFNTDPLELDVSQAVPLGLILNEAITNSIKYAFPDNNSGVISISLSNTSPGHHLLSISDNGIGIPTDLKKAGSLGMSLMKGLSEDLDGHFSIENNNGTVINISFVRDMSVKRSHISASALINSN
ncbi:MAG: tetratricopeptide repeat protein, partial [Chitinophagaceae bacterium]|nr:tetratricopeptide repeat protein [Chitinophagaceae bacterium]